MSVLFLTISVSFVIALVFFSAFLWTVKNGQYEDLDGPSVRMLFESKKSVKQMNNNNNK